MKHGHGLVGAEAPDCDVCLIMASSTFESIAGIVFEAILAFEGDNSPVHGRLTVPADMNDPTVNLAMNAWLWLEGPVPYRTGARFTVKLKEACDSRLDSDQMESIQCYHGYTFVGFIYRNHTNGAHS